MIGGMLFPTKDNVELYLGWSDWQEQFAWWPRLIRIQEYETQQLNLGGTISYSKDPVYRWVWLKRYWQRNRLHHSYIDKYGTLIYDQDYAFDLFELVQKS